MRVFGRQAESDARVYFTGGTTAVLEGWRETTIDIDLKFFPELDSLYRAIPKLKEQLDVNVELAAPSDFIPSVPGWEERSRLICFEGKVTFYNYDLYSQALSKIERSHKQDIADVETMFARNLIEPEKLVQLFERIEPALYKYPAVDPAAFSRAVSEFAERMSPPKRSA
jgi:hypothetical protein